MSLADGLGCEQEALAVLHFVGGASVGMSIGVSVRVRHGDGGWKGRRGHSVRRGDQNKGGPASEQPDSNRRTGQRAHNITELVSQPLRLFHNMRDLRCCIRW